MGFSEGGVELFGKRGGHWLERSAREQCLVKTRSRVAVMVSN